jgi:translation initiation factor 2 subunit 1
MRGAGAGRGVGETGECRRDSRKDRKIQQQHADHEICEQKELKTSRTKPPRGDTACSALFHPRSTFARSQAGHFSYATNNPLPGYIDLSKRRVSPEDILKCEERYNKSKMVHSILRHVAEKCSIPIEDLYQKIGWPLNKKYGHAVDAFKLSITNPDVWSEIEFQSDAVKQELVGYIGRRLTPQPTKVRADVEVTCFGYEGIDAVKNALRTAEARNTKDTQVKVKLVSPPLYVLTSQCLDKTTGIQTLEAAIQDIEANIRANGGSCVTRMAPKAVTESDDAELAALMEKRQRENEEISGDEEESDPEAEGEI